MGNVRWGNKEGSGGVIASSVGKKDIANVG